MKTKSIFLVIFILLPFVFACSSGGGDNGSTDTSGENGRDVHLVKDGGIDVFNVEDIVDISVTKECMPPCTKGSCCSGSCVDLGTDTSNCGACGHACKSGESCIAGECRVCTPKCDGKSCGDDGCGGTCGKCTSKQACVDGKCVACTGSCEGKQCGDDGCGHSCGTCPAGKICSEGACVTCTPNCTGKHCGDDDGCGGYCNGDCPGGGTCNDGVCVGGCIPNCSGKECGNDGCGGKCGECSYPEKCGKGGVCECISLCTTEGRQCGYDGCGGSCGTCPEGQICADGASGAVVATYQCLDISTGCADGVREGFKDQKIYPTIASCAATWPAQSMRTTRTGALCGNNLGPCTVPEDACAPGWHLCMKNGWPGDLADRISGEDCNSPIAGNTTFVAGSQVVDDNGKCTLPLPCNTRSVICCGTGCDHGDYCVWKDMSSWVPYTDCNNFGGSNIGVLCCKDPPVVGH